MSPLNRRRIAIFRSSKRGMMPRNHDSERSPALTGRTMSMHS